MSPKQHLTTNYKNPITVMFDNKTQINNSFNSLLKCRIIYKSNEILINDKKGNSCTIPESLNHSESQQIVVIPTFDGIHSVSDPKSFTLNIVSPFPRVIDEQSFVSEDGLNIILTFERSIDIFVPKTMFSQEVCDYYLTNSTLNRLKSFGLNHCKWLSRTQHSITLDYPIGVNFFEISLNANTIREYGQRFTQTNTEEIEVNVKKTKRHVLSDTDPQIVLRGPTLLPLCGAFSLSAYFYSPKGSTNVVFKWSVITLPFRKDLISDQLFKIIEENNKTSLLLMGQMFSLETISYKFTISAKLEDRTVIEAYHQMLRSGDSLPIVTIFPTPQPNQQQITSHSRYDLI